MAYEQNELRVNRDEQKFELSVENKTALIEYRKKGNKMYLVHTETPTELEGKGVASALVEKTFHYLEEHHLQMVLLCPFIQSYLQKHPEWSRLVENENE